MNVLCAIHWSGLLTDPSASINRWLFHWPLESLTKFSPKFGPTNMLILEHLQRSYTNDSKYNFVVQALPFANQPVISLEPAQKLKRIVLIDQWLTAFQTFVAIYMVRFLNNAPALTKHTETVQDLAAKNAHWHYYDGNFHFLQQKHFSLGIKFIGNCGCRCTT